MSVQEIDPRAAAARRNMSAAEWEARVDLAAAHRFVAHFGWTNLIYNHVTLRVPDQPDYFLLKPHGLMFDEVTASSLVKLPIDGTAPPRQGKDPGMTGEVQTAGFNIHTAVLAARPDINCVVHVHTQAGMAISACKEGLLPINQGAMRFYNRIVFHDYEGISNDASERERIAHDIQDKKVMIMRNHGLLTCGVDARDACSLMKFLVDACETQLKLQATGLEIVMPSPEVCELAARQWEVGEPVNGAAVWPAVLRMLDRKDPSYRN